ncbi:MAG: hypothetical protein QW244_01630 [Candidatus Pacearchaeota archaeon]
MREVADLFNKSKENLKRVDYFAEILYPRIRDKKMLQKIFLDLVRCMKQIVEALILYEFLYKRIPEKKINLEIFKKIATKYLSTYEIKLIEEHIQKSEEIEKASVDFLKQDSYIVLKNNGNFLNFSIDDVKKSSYELKKIQAKLEEKFRKDLLMSKYLKN